MAFTNFYLVAGGSGALDNNAGSSTGSRQVQTTGGTWVGATNTFTAASGTPFASTVAGDYASVYVDGGTVTTYVAKVATVTSSTVIVLDGTIKYGTAPSDGVNTRSCSINGAWATEQVLAAGGLAGTTVPQSTKINIKGNLTVTASRTISMAGATTTPLWFSGYNANPGDLDNDTTNSLAKPTWTFNSTLSFTTSGTHQAWSGISLVGTAAGVFWTASSTVGFLSRFRVENTSANAAAVALRINSNGVTAAYGWCKCPTSATTTGVIQISGITVLSGVTAEGGGIAGFNCSSNATRLYDCIGLSNTGASVLASTAVVQIVGFTSYAATVDGVKWTGTPGTGSCVIGSLFNGANGGSATTNGINNASGTNTNIVYRSCNDYYNVTNPEVGFGDSPAWFGQTDSNPVVVSATNLTPRASANAKNNGFPGVFENEAFSSFAYIGAVQPTAPAGFFIP